MVSHMNDKLTLFAGRRSGQLVLTRMLQTPGSEGASPELPWARESRNPCKLTEG